MKKKLLSLALSLMLAVCGLTACTSGDAASAGNPALAEQKELTISVCYDFYYIDEAVSLFKQTHPGVEITVEKYSNDYEKYTAQIATNLMAGTAGDIIDAVGIDFYKHSDSGLLADIYKLMEKDSGYDPNEYFTNVFKGMEYKNALYVFPTCFYYDHTGVNNKFSDQLVSMFGALDTVNFRALMDIYLSLDGTDGFYMCENFDATNAIFEDICKYVDIENKICYFNNPEFIQLINDAHALTAQDKPEGTIMSSNISFPSNDSDNSKKYLFSEIYSDNYQYFLDFEEYEYFIDFKPVADDNGRLKMSPSKTFCITENSKNKELAWEFIKFLTSMEANTDTFVPGLPIKKSVYDVILTEKINSYIDWLEREGMHGKSETEEMLAKAKAYLDEVAAMPMIYQNLSTSLMMIIYEDMAMFRDGLMTAEQVAEDLQNKVSLALLE